jgi:uncharacterized BrkB/YihY/UPF0761 family membrane protein
MDEQHQIPIWFFIGALLLVYGVLITGVGLYQWVVPPERPVKLAEWHADIWWGALMAVVGAFYAVRFRPAGS